MISVFPSLATAGLASLAPRARTVLPTQPHPAAGYRPSLADQPAHVLDELAPLDVLDPLGERLLRVVGPDRHGDPRDDRAGVDAAVHEVERGAGDLHAVRQGVARAVDAGER